MAKFFVSPSNQDNNTYGCGHTNEAEACGKIGKALAAALVRNGQEVLLMHEENISTKVAKANSWGAEYYIPVHTNAYNGTVAGTRMFYGSAGSPGHKLCKAIFDRLAPLTPGTSENIKPATYAEIVQPKAYTAYIEVDFHDNPTVAEWLHTHTTEIGETIAKGVCDFLGMEFIPDNAQTAPAEPEKVPDTAPVTPEPTQHLYRVRTSWDNPGSQIGAYGVLDNAKRACAPGYFVYDESGTPLFYRVGKNDGLWGIAKRAYGTGAEYKRIMELNGMSTSVIYPNQLLIIPKM